MVQPHCIIMKVLDLPKRSFSREWVVLIFDENDAAAIPFFPSCSSYPDLWPLLLLALNKEGCCLHRFPSSHIFGERDKGCQLKSSTDPN